MTDLHGSGDSDTPAGSDPPFEAQMASIQSTLVVNDQDHSTQPLRSSPPYHQHNSSPILHNNLSSPPQKTVQLPSSPQKFQIHPKLLINPYATEPTYFTRPNRYFGPESTWRSWTEADRAVSSSLERLKAEDLSAHLYNAYALKRRSSQLKAARAEGGDIGDENGETPFEPPRVWTAWPMPPEEVPRERFLRNLNESDEEKNGMVKDIMPSVELEECLIATAQRYARGRWDSRGLEDGKQTTKASNLGSTKKHAKQKATKEGGGDVDVSMQDEIEMGTALPSSNASQTSASSRSVTPPAKKNEIQYFSSQAFAKTSQSDSSDDIDSDASEELHRPVFTADDDRMRELLLPSARHLMGKLDNLLEAIHRSRRAYAYGRGPRSQSRSQSRFSTNDEVDSEQEDVTKVDDFPMAKGRKRRRETSVHLSSSPRKHRLDSRLSGGSVSESRSQSYTTSRSKSAALQPHDWSSVIGMASILGGFAPETIERASERCARLFDENMLFRTFHEVPESGIQQNPDVSSIEGASRRPPIEEHFALDDADESEDDDSMVDNSHPFTRSTTRYVRISAACIRCRENKLRCEPSPKETDKSHQNETISCQMCLEQTSLPCSGIEYDVRLPHNPHPTIICPHTHCERHTIPFQRVPDLKRHLTLSHNGKPPSSLTINSLLPTIDAEIYCPVPSCPRSKSKGTDQPFKTTSKMYQHVRSQHPDMDIEEVKKMELRKRGDGRGKWTDERRRRRKRSRSKAGLSGMSSGTEGRGGNSED